MSIYIHSISPSKVVRGEGAWINSLELISKLCKRPLILGRSSSTKKIRTSFKKDLLLKGIQSMLDQHKITDYKILIPQGNKAELIDKFQFVWDNELLEYRDALLQHEYEQEEYYGWYH